MKLPIYMIVRFIKKRCNLIFLYFSSRTWLRVVNSVSLDYWSPLMREREKYSFFSDDGKSSTFLDRFCLKNLKCKSQRRLKFMEKHNWIVVTRCKSEKMKTEHIKCIVFDKIDIWDYALILSRTLTWNQIDVSVWYSSTLLNSPISFDFTNFFNLFFKFFTFFYDDVRLSRLIKPFSVYSTLVTVFELWSGNWQMLLII